jgi:hypothetical protein
MLEGSVLIAVLPGRALAYYRHGDEWRLEHELVLPSCAADTSTCIEPLSADLSDNVLALGGNERVALFERSATRGWNATGVLRASDEQSVGRGFGSTVGVGPTWVAVLASRDTDFGAGSGTLYLFNRAPDATYDMECFEPVTTPGAGTACTSTGSTASLCTFVDTEVGSLEGTTPAGPLDLGHVWVDRVNGFTESLTVVFGASVPRRGDAVPRVSARVDWFRSFESLPLDIEVDVEVTLCDQSLTLPGTLTVLEATNANHAGVPFAGKLMVSEPGWDLTGSFDARVVCKSHTSL